MDDYVAFVGVVEKHLECELWDELCILLDDRFAFNPDEPISRPTFQINVKILCDLLSNQCVQLLKDGTYNPLRVITHLLKALRNTAANSKSCQTYIAQNDSILSDVFCVISFAQGKDHDEAVRCVKMALQFLTNLVVAGNIYSANRVTPMIDPLLRRLLSNPLYCYHTAALIYNLFLVDPNLSLQKEILFKDAFDLYHQDPSNEYVTFLLEYFIKHEHLSQTYVTYPPEHRTLFLKLAKKLSDENHTISQDVVNVLCNEFKRKCERILLTVTDNTNEVEAQEVFLLLEVLATLSGYSPHTEHLNRDMSLLTTCVYLLRSVHQLGKQSNNYFTPLPKLSDLKNIGDDDYNHVTFGFKASLVRIIGNLSWKNKEAQDEIRSLDCIPMILECCNIDARNPLIMQWAILGIRNICENNLENQNVIASLSKQGVVSSTTLQDIGITLEDNGKKQIIIAPLDLKK